MLNKAITLVAVLALLTLLAAPLVLAQQQDTSQDTTQAQPPAGEAQVTLPTLGNPFSLDANGNLVTDCDVAYSNFARLQLVADQLRADPTFQAELARAQGLVQICVDEGIQPGGGLASDGSNSAGMEQYQPQQ